jgi:membrane protein required for colicin V production
VKPFLQAGGDKLRDMLPDDLDSIIAKIKAKKGNGQSGEAPPSETEMDKSSQPATENPPEETPPATGGAN